MSVNDGLGVTAIYEIGTDLLILNDHCTQNFEVFAMTGAPDIHQTKDGKNDLFRVFRLFNMSDTGRIDHFELLLALKELGVTSCLHTTRRILESIDLDKSGAIEFEDFCQFFAKARSEDEVKRLLTEEAIRCLEYKETAESGDPNFARQYKTPSCQKPLSRYSFHRETVTGLSWVDSSHFISTSLDGFICKWNHLDTSAPTNSFKPLGEVSAPIYSHCVHGDPATGHHIIGMGAGHGLAVVALPTASVKWKTPIDSDIMSVCSLGPNAAVTGTKNGRCTLFDLQTSSLTHLLVKDTQVIQSVHAISPSTIAVGFHSGFVDILDIRSPSTSSLQFEGCMGKLNSVIPHNNHIFTGGDDFIIRKFDLRKIGRDDPEKFLGHSSAITALQIAKNDQRLFSGSSDGSVRVWELTSSVPATVKFQDSPGDASVLISASTRALVGHSQAVKCISVDETEPNGKVITGSIDTSVNCYV